MSPIEDEYVDIPVVLHLKKNISELLRILSICYSEYPTLNSELLNKFCSSEITKIVTALVEAPPYPEDWPENFKRSLKNILNEDNTTINNNSEDDLTDLK